MQLFIWTEARIPKLIPYAFGETFFKALIIRIRVLETQLNNSVKFLEKKRHKKNGSHC